MRLAVVLPLLALTACATPQEACLTQVSQELSINRQLIARTDANIRRGFALRTEQRVREVNRTCRGETESGEAVRIRCEEVLVRNVRVPEAIDLNAERAKLRSLQDRRRTLLAGATARTAQCRALPNG